MNPGSLPGKMFFLFVILTLLFSTFPGGAQVTYAAAPGAEDAPTEAPDSQSGAPGAALSAPADTSALTPTETPAGGELTPEPPSGQSSEPPTGEPPTGEPPTGETPTGEAPAGEAPTGEPPTGEAPTALPSETPAASPTPTEDPLLSATDASQYPSEQRGKVQAENGLNGILSRIEAEGSMRLIVGMDVDFVPVGELSPAGVSRQSADIAAGQQAVLNDLRGRRADKIKKFDTIPFMALETDKSGLNALLASGEVSYVQEDKLSKPGLNLSVPRIGANTAWGRGFTGSGITVAILDTGVEKNHAFLSGSVVSEACYSTTYSYHGATSICPGGVESSTAAGSAMPYAGTCPAGECDHGTHVAGIAAGGSGGSLSGVAYNAGIIAIQVFSRFDGADAYSYCGYSPCALSYDSDQIAGLERVYALRNTYTIAAVNMSLGGGGYTTQSACNTANSATKAAIDNLRSAGIATVISSGNDGYTNAISGPGCISSAVSVGATTDSDAVASYSNSASFLNLLAPGSAINSSVPGGSYQSWNGTSMAAPHVTGTWAILKQAKPAASVTEVLEALTSTGTGILDGRNGITKPRINVNAALSLLATDIPVPIAPLGKVTSGNRVTYQWHAAEDASEYQLVVRDATGASLYDMNFTPAQVGCPYGGTCSYAVAESLPNGSYTWNVRAYNTEVNDWSAWSPNTAFTIALTVPGRPTLLSPSGTVSSSNVITYTWNALAGVEQYELLVKTSSGATVVSTTATPTAAGCAAGTGSCALTVSESLANGVYLWMVRSGNSAGWSAWSVAKSFTLVTPVPAVPTLVSPSGTISATNVMTYTWNAVSTAEQYQLMVKSANGRVTYHNAVHTATETGCYGGSGTCTFALADVLVNGAYVWYVRAANASGWGVWSPAKSFTVAVPLPAKPVLVSPAGVITATNEMTYTWNALPDVLQYRLIVKKSTGAGLVDALYTPADLGCSGGTGTCAVSLPDELLNGRYVWYVRAANGFGWGTISDAKIFTIAIPVPAKPVQVSPSGTVSDANTITYSWNAIAKATNYHLWVRTSRGATLTSLYKTPADAGCPDGTGVCSFSVAAPLANGAYVWLVRAANRTGWGAYATTAFTVNVPVPAAPLLLTPSGVVSASNSATYTWNAIADADQYEVLVRRVRGATVLSATYTPADAACDAGEPVCTFAVPDVLANGAYTWSMRAHNSYGWGLWSAAKSFSMAYPVPVRPLLVSPNGVISDANTVTYAWNALAGATQYQLMVRNAAGAIQRLTIYSPADAGCPDGSGACSVAVPDVLLNGRYSWTVRAANTTGWGAWSAGIVFTIAAPIPATAVMLTPSGAFTAANTATYTWNAIAGVDQYELLVKRTKGLVTVHNAVLLPADAGCAAGEPTCSVSVPTFLPNGAYTWFVRGHNAFGWGLWPVAKSFSMAYPVPGLPQQVSPNGSVTDSNQMTYTWNALSGATQYQLLVRNASRSMIHYAAYSAADAGCPDGSGTCSLAVADVLVNGNYTWQMRAANTTGWGAWTAVRAFSVSVPVPASPLLVSPALVVPRNTASYVWSAVGGADEYELLVKRSTGTVVQTLTFTPGEVDCASGETECAYDASQILSNGKYIGLVRAHNTFGWGNWSAGKAFTIAQPVPARPILVSPSGVNADANTRTYTWYAISGVTRYQLMVRTSSGAVIRSTLLSAADAGCPDGTGTCAFAAPEVLANRAYTWIVRAENSAGWGAWSTALAFSIAVPIPPAPLQGAPGGTYSAQNVFSYTWNAHSDADQYEILMRRSTGATVFSGTHTPADLGCPAGTGTCTLAVPDILPNTGYYWMVRAHNSYGWGAWTAVKRFTVAVPVPPKPVQVSPSGTVVTTNTMTYTWNAISNATKYQLMVTNAAGSSLHNSEYTPEDAGCAGTATCSLARPEVLANGSYRWYVRAANTVGWGLWSAAKLFSVGVPLPVIPNHVSPSGTISNNQPTFTWYPASSALAYQFYLGSAGGTEIINREYTPAELGCSLTSACSIQPATLDFNTAYVWYVRARNSYGYGAWHSGVTFTPKLDKPVALSPSGGGLETQPDLTWGAVNYATEYYVWLQTPSAVLINGTYSADSLGCAGGTGTCTFATTGLDPLAVGAYYWTVQAGNAGQYSGFNAVNRFLVLDALADEDGDSLPNGWEINGYDADGNGTIEVDLPALGARWNHKDLFVEMDYMVRASATYGFAPNAAVMTNIVNVFAAAPLSNPDGTTGVDIHLELDDQVPLITDLSPVWTQVDTLKATYFDPNRTKTHHYMIWADSYEDSSSSGLSRGIGATDFLVTLGRWNNGAGGTDAEKTGTFIHELGHNLGLMHGGTDHVNYKPNYLSIMNYTYQMIGLYRNGCWGDLGCPLNFDYQRVNTPALNEMALNEVSGLGSALSNYGTIWTVGVNSWFDSTAGSYIDWNRNGRYTTSVVADINGDGLYTTSMTARNDWQALSFSGGGVIGSGLAAPTLLRRMSDTVTMDELTWEEHQELQKMIKR